MRTLYLQHKLLETMGAVIVFFAIAAPAPALAEVYKCITASGTTTYNDKPCKVDESTYLLSKSARQVEGLDCRIARNFALDTARRMRQSDSATDIFNAYGGAESLTKNARRLINHVYTFENNTRVTMQQIVDLTTERCQAGLLGSELVRCEAFPEQFILRDANCADENLTKQRIQNALHDYRTAPVPLEKPGTYAPISNTQAFAVRSHTRMERTQPSQSATPDNASSTPSRTPDSSAQKTRQQTASTSGQSPNRRSSQNGNLPAVEIETKPPLTAEEQNFR